ncbi:hypothetical protein BH23THE1_BH23THE1_29960 [soil metagenome]
MTLNLVGCDGTGSVGSSGDVNVGSNNNNDTSSNGNGNGNGNGDTPLPPVTCERDCFAEFSAAERNAIAIALGVELATGENVTLAELCAAINAIGTVEALIVALDEAGLSVTAIVDLLACLGIDVDLLGIDVDAVLGGIV